MKEFKDKTTMTMLEIFENNYEDLTQCERDVITTTDLNTAKSLNFESVEDFKEWAEDIDMNID